MPAERSAISIEVVQSAFWQTNSGIITDGQGNIILIDPGVFPEEFSRLAERTEQGRVIAGLATHEDWDHVLWSESLEPTVPRYADAAVARVLEAQRDVLLKSLTDAEAEFRVSWDHDEVGRHLPLPGDDVVFGDGIRIQVIPTPGHTPVHTSFWLPDEGVLFAGDILSDIDIPMLAEMPDAVTLYLSSLARIQPFVEQASLIVPGHGAACGRDAALARLAGDRIYLNAIRQQIAERPSLDVDALARISGDALGDSRLEWTEGWNAHLGNIETIRRIY